jgi:hypothetical protein
MRAARLLLVSCLACAIPVGCVVYEPVPVRSASPSTIDRARSAAQGALQDVGVRVTSVDHVSGVILGTKEGIDVSVSVVLQADGRTRVQFDAKGPSGADPALAERFSQAYERRMGR